MKVLQSAKTESAVCNECEKNESNAFDQHKTNVIQDLLKTHNNDESLKSHIRLPGISEILPSLYLCGAGVAIPVFLEKLGITCVINAAPELPETPLPLIDGSKPVYLQVPVLDKSDIDISNYFDEVSDLIEQIRQTNGKTMVHCVAGVSRSASLVLAYLMKYWKMSLKGAFELVRTARPQIRPNIGFVRQLIFYEEKLFQKVTVTMVFKESLGCEIPDIYEMEYQALEIFYHKHRHLKLR
ncbi:dual specificity protein phosphatase 18 isoform X2 [Sitodiplosis mosellana]|uniref:dual specificity protein phosphatase 18 isoform X2 n=1 Tax=Sitodiplosis mosellana TaxID=263140 RepID=UPI002444F96B|nr:dual specificity protein phosphatase 18 isoform X2 [Sitodiplosis mosellana]XP_055315685.1 dual specificity protein phosphatase 18 isoform X2 [Sitodiplosis mosellana]